MKTVRLPLSLAACAASLLITSSTVFAQADEGRAKPAAGEGPGTGARPGMGEGRQPPPFRSALQQKFDKDGDGKLNETEKAAAKAAGLELRKELLAKYDKDGDGKLADSERDAARQDLRERTEFLMLDKHDQDGDGELSESELAAAREEMRSRLGGQRGGGAAGTMRGEMLKRFDKDGDGKLNETEKAAAQEAVNARLGQEGGTAAGPRRNGEANPERHAKMIKDFDKDGDGKLSEEERKAAMEARNARRGEQGGPGAPPPAE